MNEKQILSAIESMLYASGEAVSCEDIIRILGITRLELSAALIALENKYSTESGIRLVKFNDKIQFATNKENARYIEALLNPTKQRSLSQSALEVLSIIAYKQPVTRGDIEQIRGIKCDYTVSMLCDRGLIREAGHRDTLGRPTLFVTTDEFLRYFGLAQLADLPKQEDLLDYIQTMDEEEN